MARHKGSKFSFPLPGRKSHPKLVESVVDDRDNSNTIHGRPTVPPTPSSYSSTGSHHHHQPAPSSSRFLHTNPSSATSKAQRILGTDGPPFRPSSRQTSSVPPFSPTHVTVTLSDAASDRTAPHEYSLPKPSAPSNRASSTLLPPSSMAYIGSEPPTSPSSSFSRHLRPRGSDSTMRSHYDARSSPLSISQQTSNSAVRDLALRKGKPQIVTSHADGNGNNNSNDHYSSSPLSHETFSDTTSRKNKGSNRRSATPRLDLAKLFPKPRGHGGQGFDKSLLSPNKMVNSPMALSPASDYFPQPMPREPTPTLRGQAKLTKPRPQQNSSAQIIKRTTSPTRLYKRDQYDNAKINVRRPPPGIKHWFDGFDSDEFDEEEDVPPALPPVPAQHRNHEPVLRQKNSFPGHMEQSSSTSRTQQPHVAYQMLDPRKAQYNHSKPTLAHRLNSPSQLSLQSLTSQTTAKTKDSSLSRSNLQNSSVLSFSSSEDEGDSDVDSSRAPNRNKVSVRDSINMAEHGDIIIGQAEAAFPVRPTHNRKSSVGKLSMMSTSTNAATIEVMYTPEPYAIQQFPRNFSTNSRRSSHVRQQPSVIREAEGEEVRPRTAVPPQSPSSRSVRTSTSEPRSRLEAQKFMAVTPEEEALLEALRKKRAAMMQQNLVQGYSTEVKEEEVTRQVTPPQSKQKSHRTSAFLSTDSPSESPVRVVDEKKKSGKKTPAPLQTPLASAMRRGRSAHAQNSSGESSGGNDSSLGETLRSDRYRAPAEKAAFPRRLSPPEFSPLDLFPTPSKRLSVISQSTTDHLTPFPSPITPGLRNGESDIVVKVASSEPSMHSDNDEVAVFDTGVIDPPPGSIKPDDPSSNHRRRRTASSGTDIPVTMLRKPGDKELRPVSEVSSVASYSAEPPTTNPKLPRKSSLRKSVVSVSTTGFLNSRQNSVSSSRTSSPARNHLGPSRSNRGSRATSRVGSMGSTTSIARNSISDDVLAAWGSLGGNYDGPRF